MEVEKKDIGNVNTKVVQIVTRDDVSYIAITVLVLINKSKKDGCERGRRSTPK